VWFEEFDFEKDPYEKLDPYRIDFKRLVWDRPDLPNAKEAIDKFIGEICEGKRTALKIYGSSGGGKTWLTRIIQKELSSSLKDADKGMIFIYTKVPRIEPTFQIVYRIGIEYFLSNYFKTLLDGLKGNRVQDWEKLVQDHDLALCFHNYSSGTPVKKAIARKWLIGDKLSASELSNLEITYAIDSDYERLEMLRKLVEKLSNAYFTFVLVIDELENASTKLAGQISDALRDLLDSFSEKFALITSFTAQKIDEWYDLGYTEALNRRFDYSIELSSLSQEKLADFLRIHHKAYRNAKSKVKDELLPFLEDGAIKLLNLMSPQYHYPGYFLPNCKAIARAAEGKVEEINASFLQENFQLVPFK
jgi:hypothetical protein